MVFHYGSFPLAIKFSLNQGLVPDHPNFDPDVAKGRIRP